MEEAHIFVQAARKPSKIINFNPEHVFKNRQDMNNTIFKSDIITVHYDDSEDYMVVEWEKECGNILDEDYSGEIDKIKEMVKDKTPEKLLVDMSGCSYSITPDTGPWYKNSLFEMYGEISANKVAIVLPHNLHTHAFFDSVAAHENVDFKTEIQYFSDTGKAFNWLNLFD